MARSPARRPRGRETTPDRPSGLRLWLRRRRPMLRPALRGLLAFAVLAGVTLVVMTFDPAGRLARGFGSTEAIGRMAGLTVQDVTLEGRQNTPLELVRAALGVTRGDPILAFSPREAQERLESIAWVETAHVERRLPGSIVVRIQERRPFAIWQFEGRFRVIDREGTVVSDRIGEFGPLPLLVGAGANKAGPGMVELLRGLPELRDRAQALIRVGDRRWNVVLRNGTVVKLPEQQEAAALRRLLEFHAGSAVLDRPVAGIDLRFSDRVVVDLATQQQPVQTQPAAAPEAPPPPRNRSRAG